MLVKLIPQQFKSFRKVHKGLVRKYEGPFPILGRVDKVSYKVELPPRLKIHPVFHVSNLKPYHEDKEDPDRGISTRAPTTVVTSYDKEVDYIIADQVLRKNNFQRYKEYLVKWKGLLESEASWEPVNTLWQFQKQIERFQAERMKRTSAALVGENVTPFIMETSTQDPNPTIGYSKVHSLAYPREYSKAYPKHIPFYGLFPSIFQAYPREYSLPYVYI